MAFFGLTGVLLSFLPAAACGNSHPSAQAAHSSSSSAFVSDSASAPVASTDPEPVDAGTDTQPERDLLSVDAGNCAVGLPKSNAGTLTNASTDASVDRAYADIQAVFRQNSSKFQPCVWHATQASNPEKNQGRVVFTFTIDVSGKVINSVVDDAASEVKDPTARQCVLQALKSLPFPASRRGIPTTVTYPLDFRPGCPSR